MALTYSWSHGFSYSVKIDCVYISTLESIQQSKREKYVTLQEAWLFAEWDSCEENAEMTSTLFEHVKIQFHGQPNLIDSHIFTLM